MKTNLLFTLLLITNVLFSKGTSLFTLTNAGMRPITLRRTVGSSQNQTMSAIKTIAPNDTETISFQHNLRMVLSVVTGRVSRAFRLTEARHYQVKFDETSQRIVEVDA